MESRENTYLQVRAESGLTNDLADLHARLRLSCVTAAGEKKVLIKVLMWNCFIL
jgi:hypothetical protein